MREEIILANLAHLHVRRGKLTVDLVHIPHSYPGAEGPAAGVQSAPGVLLALHQPRVRPGLLQAGRDLQVLDVATAEAPLEAEDLAEGPAGPDEVVALVQPGTAGVGTGGAGAVGVWY